MRSSRSTTTRTATATATATAIAIAIATPTPTIPTATTATTAPTIPTRAAAATSASTHIPTTMKRRRPWGQHGPHTTTTTTTTTTTRSSTVGRRTSSSRRRSSSSSSSSRNRSTRTAAFGSSTTRRTTVLAMVLIASSLVDGLPFWGGVNAQQIPTTTPDDPIEEDVTPTPTPVVTEEDEDEEDNGPSSPLVTILKEAFPLAFELVLESNDAAELDQLTNDVDGVLEKYLLENLSPTLESDNTDSGLDIRDVTLRVTLPSTTRQRERQRERKRERPQLFLRRALQQQPQPQPQQPRDIAVRVDGNIIYDIDASGCVECIDQQIDTQLSTLLGLENINRVLAEAQLEDVTGVTLVRPASELDNGNNGNGGEAGGGGNRGDVTKPDTSGLQQTTETDGKDNILEKPATLSIVFGFVLTGIATIGLCVYAFLWYRKRKKRIRKQRQQRQSIEYRMPSSSQRVSPNKAAPLGGSAVKRIPPPPPTSASTPGPPDEDDDDDDDSDASSFKGVDSVASDGDGGEGPPDSFARELQVAASLDQEAWDDFQRKKSALDHHQQQALNPMDFKRGAAAAVVVARAPKTPTPDEGEGEDDASETPTTWTKSFPYGDESHLGDENDDPRQQQQQQGIEWTEAMGRQGAPPRGESWEPYSSSVSSHEEKKDEHDRYRGTRDPEATASNASAAVLQSIERTLSQYGDQEQQDESLASDDVVDEVARLSRFVQKYEKRKERRMQREFSQKSPSEAGTLSPSHSDPMGVRGSMLREQPPPEQVMGKKRGYAAQSAPQKQRGDSGSQRQPRQQQQQQPRYVQKADDQPRITSYTGITMAGGLYQDPSLQNINREIFNMSSDSEEEESFRDEEGSLWSQRLGITPFDAQRPEVSAHSEDRRVSPMTQKLARGEAINRSRGSPENDSTPTDERTLDNDRAQREAEVHRKQKQRLSSLRTNQAIIDNSQSDVNVGFFPNPGEPHAPAPVPRQVQQPAQQQKKKSRIPFLRSAKTSSTTTTKDTSPNPRFNKLRSLFEEKPKNAIFPPDEHWQSGVSKT